ncbi:MAG: hypothetical protein IPM42_12610 [Saprospiraceae bacterium]|nr:hypothetical protein [Saprospiraceae bacterium]
MSNYISISGPFASGLRPKSFFSETKEIYRSKLMNSEAGVKAPKSKYHFESSEKGSENPVYNEFMVMAPWILAGSVLLLSFF